MSSTNCTAYIFYTCVADAHGEKTALDDQAATVGVAFQHAQRDVDRVNDQLMAEAKRGG